VIKSVVLPIVAVFAGFAAAAVTTTAFRTGLSESCEIEDVGCGCYGAALPDSRAPADLVSAVYGRLVGGGKGGAPVEGIRELDGLQELALGLTGGVQS
jgi:hypothetical protein